ncbi:hypothetical protein JCM16303_003308 [Sporobolomyces ruberrimus]
MKGLLVLYLVSLAVAITSLGISIASLLHSDWIEVRPFSSSHKDPAHSPINLHTSTSYGLFEACTTTTYSLSSRQRSHGGLKTKKECRKFPVRGVDCGIEQTKKKKKQSGAALLKNGSDSVGIEQHDTDRDESFCDRWLLAGYAHQLSLIFSLTSILSLSLTLLGTLRAGRGYRTERLRSGWKLAVGLMSLQAASLAVAWIVVRWEFGNESLFNLPWGHKSLGSGFIETVTAFGLLLVTILSILFVRYTQRLRIVPEGAAREDGYDEIRDD